MLAQEDSRVLGYDYIGTEHLLLGIMHEEHGVGALVLADIDLDLETLSNKAIEMIPPAGKVPPGHPWGEDPDFDDPDGWEDQP